MLKLVIIIIAAIFIVCAAGFAILVIAELYLKKDGGGRRHFTCYISGEDCLDPDNACTDCRIFRNRMEPEKAEDAVEAIQEEVRDGLRRSVAEMESAPVSIGQEPPLTLPEPPVRTQEPPTRTQEIPLRIQEPPIEPEFVDTRKRNSSSPDEWIAETGPLVCTGEEKPLPDAGPVSRIPREPWMAGKEVMICAFKNAACRLPELGDEACRACFYMRDGEMLLRSSEETETK